MGKILAVSMIWAISLAAFLLGIRSARGKGFLLNNAYLYASGKERETMDKKPYYRQSAVVFCLIGLLFFLNGLALLLEVKWISYIAWVIMGITVMYAILSGIAIKKRKQQKNGG